MLNLLTLVKESTLSLLARYQVLPKEFHETPIGAGYYAMRKTKSRSGRVYTKLVKRDRSGSSKVRSEDVTQPIIGMRYPEKRKGRRKVTNE